MKINNILCHLDLKNDHMFPPLKPWKEFPMKETSSEIINFIVFNFCTSVKEDIQDPSGCKRHLPLQGVKA